MLFRFLHIKSIRFNLELFLENKMTRHLKVPVINSISANPLALKQDSEEGNIKCLLLIKDIPSYLTVFPNTTTNQYTFKSIAQYQGFLINLSQYGSLEAYLKTQLSKRNIKNLVAKQKKLEAAHQIRYEVFNGPLDKQTYEVLFEAFYNMLLTRFQQKKIDNRYLSQWNQLKLDTYRNLLHKKASLHVIFSDETPITITLNYHLEDITFSHIQAYNIRYAAYNMGDIAMLKQLEWCFEQQKKVFDMSIGQTAYKTKWCNQAYTSNYLVCYPKKSMLSSISAHVVVLGLIMKQHLRNYNIIGHTWSIDALKYKLNRH